MNEQIKLIKDGQEFAMFLNDAEFEVFGERLLSIGWKVANADAPSPSDSPAVGLG